MRFFFLFSTLFLLTVMIVFGLGKLSMPASSGPSTSEPVKAAKTVKTAPEKVESAPNFTGKWVGTWSSIANEGQGGKLTCETIAKSDDEWTANVIAEYSIADDGPSETYKVNLKGVRRDNSVVFDGELDLKEQGGVFSWKGLARDGEFTGNYEGPGENGTFKMKYVSSKPAVISKQ